VPRLALQGQVTQFIHDQEVGPPEVREGFIQCPTLLGLSELVDQIGCVDEAAAPAQLDGLAPQADGEVRFTDAWRPQQEHIRGVGEIPPRLQFRE